jgi:hypothetical protein
MSLTRNGHVVWLILRHHIPDMSKYISIVTRYGCFSEQKSAIRKVAIWPKWTFLLKNYTLLKRLALAQIKSYKFNFFTQV